MTYSSDHNRVEIVKWVAESMRPLSIVDDEGFKMLMKTGRPNYKLPKRMTVARDVNRVFQKTKKRMKKLLQVSCFTENLTISNRRTRNTKGH